MRLRELLGGLRAAPSPAAGAGAGGARQTRRSHVPPRDLEGALTAAATTAPASKNISEPPPNSGLGPGSATGLSGPPLLSALMSAARTEEARRYMLEGGSGMPPDGVHFF
jgi:hypothetical protein